MKIGYSVELTGEEEKKSARALGKEMPISPKQSYEIANQIRGKKVGAAKQYLEKVTKKEVPVPYRRYNWNIPHRRGMAAGRYPITAARNMLKILKHAESNAVQKGLSKEKLRIKHLSINKGRVQHGRRKGSPYNSPTVNLQVIVAEE